LLVLINKSARRTVNYVPNSRKLERLLFAVCFEEKAASAAFKRNLD